MELENFLLKQISNSPNIAFGTLYRDVCICTITNGETTFVDINNALNSLIEKNLIVSEHRDNNTFYNLGQQLKREKKLKELGIK